MRNLRCVIVILCLLIVSSSTEDKGKMDDRTEKKIYTDSEDVSVELDTEEVMDDTKEDKPKTDHKTEKQVDSGQEEISAELNTDEVVSDSTEDEIDETEENDDRKKIEAVFSSKETSESDNKDLQRHKTEKTRVKTKPSYSEDKTDFSPTQPNEKQTIENDDEENDNNADENDDVDVTEDEIIDIMDDVDFLVRTKFRDDASQKDESAKTNINIIADVDSKEKSKDSSTIKSSSNKEVVKESLNDPYDEKNDENVDAKDLLSLLETLSIDDDSEIQILDDGDETVDSYDTGMEATNIIDTVKMSSSTEDKPLKRNKVSSIIESNERDESSPGVNDETEKFESEELKGNEGTNDKSHDRVTIISNDEEIYVGNDVDNVHETDDIEDVEKIDEMIPSVREKDESKEKETNKQNDEIDLSDNGKSVFKEMENDVTDENENVGENDEIYLSDHGNGKLEEIENDGTAKIENVGENDEIDLSDHGEDEFKEIENDETNENKNMGQNDEIDLFSHGKVNFEETQNDQIIIKSRNENVPIEDKQTVPLIEKLISKNQEPQEEEVGEINEVLRQQIITSEKSTNEKFDDHKDVQTEVKDSQEASEIAQSELQTIDDNKNIEIIKTSKQKVLQKSGALEKQLVKQSKDEINSEQNDREEYNINPKLQLQKLENDMVSDQDAKESIFESNDESEVIVDSESVERSDNSVEYKKQLPWQQSSTKEVKRKKISHSLYSETHESPEGNNEEPKMMKMMEDIEDETQQYVMNEPPLIARHSMEESPPNVIDMSMEETIKTRRLLAQFIGGEDDSEDGEVSEVAEQANSFVANIIPESTTDVTPSPMLPLTGGDIPTGTNIYSKSTTDVTSGPKLPPTEDITTGTNIYSKSTTDVTSGPKLPPTDGITTAITTFPVTTTHISFCPSNPCFAGNCTEVVGGYVCLCDAGFTGRNCDEEINPCDVTPCSAGATCIKKGTNRICVCPDGFKGPNCDTADVHVVCRDVQIRRNLREDTVINCTNRINSSPIDLCYDPDDSLVYNLANSTDGVFFSYNINDLTCLEVNIGNVVKSENCINVTATEADDVIYRPWRQHTSLVCVTFNEPPQFRLTNTTIVNIVNAKIGDVITVLKVDDPFVFDNPIYIIEGVVPPEYGSYFSVSSQGQIRFSDIPSSLPIDGQSLTVHVKVNDGGIPPLEATTFFYIALVEVSLNCNFPSETYLGIASNVTVLEDTIVCQGSTDLKYTVINSSGLSLIAGNNGAVVVIRSSTLELIPGDYNISILVSAGNIAQTFVNFTVHVGYYEPFCYRISPIVRIHKSTLSGTCFPAFYCNETITADMQCDNIVSADLGSFLSLSCIVADSTAIMELCVDKGVQQFQGMYDVKGVFKNNYGPKEIGTKVDIYNLPPRFLNLPLSANVSEDAAIGDVVMVVLVQDDFLPPLLEFDGQVTQFTLDSTSGEIKTLAKLDFEQMMSYSLPLRITDTEGMIVVSSALIKIIDVNENPVCYHVNGSYIISINASTPISARIGALNCTDPDMDVLQYNFHPQSSQNISNTFTLDNKTGIIRIKQQPSAGTNFLVFTVIISDPAGLTTDIRVQVYFSFYPPNCAMNQLQMQIKEDSTSCTAIGTTCIDPQGGSINYTRDASSNAALFDVSGAPNNSLILCPVDSLIGKVGTYQFKVFAQNKVGQTPIEVNVEIRDVNSAPFFVNLRNFTVSEKAAQGYLIGTVTAEDNDTDANFVTIRYTIDEPNIPFSLDSATGELRMALMKLNATSVSEYSFRIKVTDNGGLSDTAIVSVIVRDENEPPSCLNPRRIVQGTVSLITEVGTVVTSLVCWDHDKEDKYRTIVYNITGDNEEIFAVNGNGEIKVAKSIPRDSISFRFEVTVADLIMMETGNFTQRITLDVSIAVNKNFPPVCEKIVSNLKIEETKIVGECIEEIICNDVTLGNITIVTITGSGSSYMEVKSRTLNTQGQLPLNLCIKQNIKNQMGTYQLIATVTNGLRTATVTWNLEIIDVNEPPYFRNTPYIKDVVEYQSISSSILQIQWADPDTQLDYRTVQINSTVKQPVDAAENINFYPSTNTYYIAKTQNATVQNLYWFEVTATDGGGLSAVTNVTIVITDLNESPICPTNNVAETIGLLTPVGEIIYELSCYDTDRDENNRNISYTILTASDHFGVSSAGEITLISPLVRYKNSYTFTVVVSDAGAVPLSTTVNFVVNVNTAISAECSPSVEYPSIWVKDSCVKINMSCTDPTLDDTTHLQYVPSGSYSTAFTLNTESQGLFRLCYNLLTNSTSRLTITVSNGLLDYKYDLDLEVKYSASTPQFDVSKYTKSIKENVTIGTSVLKVRATATGGGNIVYSIEGATQDNVVNINSTTGLIVIISSLRPYAHQTITLQVQALNLLSQLKSSVDVDIIIIDVNEAPVCTLGLPVIPAVKVDSSVGTVIQNVTCNDSDIKPENKDLVYSIMGSQGAANVFKVMDITNGVSVVTNKLLPVTINKYDVNVVVLNNGEPVKEVTLPFVVNINLTPPAPSLEAYPVNMTTVRVKWSYKRVDFYTVTNEFILKLNNVVLNLPVSKDESDSYVVNLDPDTTYDVNLTAKTDYGDVVTPVVVVKTPAVPVLSRFVASIKITDETFDLQLLDPQSYKYVTLTEKVLSNLDFILNRTPGFVSGSVVMFRRGSVIVDMLVTVNQTGTVAGVSGTLQQAVSTGFLRTMSVDPNYIIIGQGDGYIRITGVTPDGEYYQESTVKFICSADIIGNVGTVTASWKLNNAVINPTSSSRLKTEVLPDDQQYPGRKQYQLTVDSLLTKDSGNISCHLSDQTLQSEWTINVNVIGKPVVAMSPITTTVDQGDSVTVECKVVNFYPNVDTNISWYKHGAVFSGDQDEVINHINISTYHVLTISSIQDTVRYTCGAYNAAGEGPRAACTITVIKTGVTYKYCPMNTDSFGTIWNRTVEDTTVVLPCTDPFTGTVSRLCTKNGVWEVPDYRNCVRVELQTVNEQSDNLKNGMEVEDVNIILEKMTELTADNQVDLRSGDLEISSSTLNNVADHAAERTNSISTNQLEEFVSSCNNLLGDRNQASWEQLKQQNLFGVSRLVKAVTVYSKAYTNVNSQKFSKIVTKENLVVQVGKIQSEDVTIPGSSPTLPTWLTDSSTQIKLNKATLSGQHPVGYSSTYYRNISSLFHQYLMTNGDVKSINGSYDVNSVIVDFSIEPAPSKLNPPLVVEFQHLSINYSRPVCGFWNFSAPNTPNGAWSTVGSRTVKSSDMSTTCEYEHTTNFAVLMSPGKIQPADVLALSIISAVGCGISLLFLLITVVIYIVLWRYLKSDRATILVNLCIALILSYILFLAGVTQTANQDVCTAMAVLLHYIFLVVFFLMLAEGIEVAFCVLYVFSTRSRVHWLLPCSWIVPAVIVAISMGATQLEGYGNSEFCWLSIESGLLWAFVGPALLVILINLIILILVLKTMLSSHSMITKTAKQQARAGMRSICVILPLFGVTWVFGVFSINKDLVVFQYLFAIFNSLQGLFIFLFHCFFNRQVREGIQHSQRRRKSTLMDLSKSTSQANMKNSVRESSSENIHNNLEEELKKSKNPFLQADNQVQQIVDKFLKTSDGKGNNLNKDKDNAISIEDIKISNIMREAEINDPPSSREEEPRNRYSTSDSEKRTSKSSSENKSSHNSREHVGQKTSSSSSRTKTSTTTRSTELNSKTSSVEDFESKIREDQSRIDHIYSASIERKTRRDNYSRSSRYSPKQQKKMFEPGPSHKKGASHWGKSKQTGASKKHRSPRDDDRTREKDREKDRHRRHRHRDRSAMYNVDYYDNPAHPVHRSMEDMPMQYMGYQQPFVRTYEPLMSPHGYHQSGYPYYDVRHPDYC